MRYWKWQVAENNNFLPTWLKWPHSLRAMRARNCLFYYKPCRKIVSHRLIVLSIFLFRNIFFFPFFFQPRSFFIIISRHWTHTRMRPFRLASLVQQILSSVKIAYFPPFWHNIYTIINLGLEKRSFFKIFLFCQLSNYESTRRWNIFEKWV